MANDRNDGTRHDWPTMLGEFRIVRQLALGPYSTSLLVRMIGDPEHRGEMVLKVLHPVSGPPWKAAMRMDTSASEASSARPHANIAGTFEKGQILNHVYVLQEYVDGIDLRTLLTLSPQPLGDLPLRAKLGIAVQLAAALEHLHSIPFGDSPKGRLIHGDLHPGNVMIDRSGVVKLMDVGFADMAMAAIRPAVTGSAVGSPGYLAPEQIANRRATPATDVFAFGSLLGELFTDEPLFVGDTTVDILEQTRNARVDAVVDHLAGIHAGAARIVRRSVTPERRGRLSDGVLLVGEMFAARMTDDAQEVLADLVERALAHKDDGIALPPRDLVAADGSLVDVGQLTDGMRDSEAGLASPGEPSHESEVPSAEPDLPPERVSGVDATSSPSVDEPLRPEPSHDEPLLPEPPPVALEPELEETEPDQPVAMPPPEPALADGARKTSPPKAGPRKAAPRKAKPAKGAPSKEKKGGKGLLILGIAAVLLVVCGGGAIAAWYGVFSGLGASVDADGDRSFEDQLAEALDGMEPVTPAADAVEGTGDETPAEGDEESTGGEEELTGDGETDGLAEEETTPEEITPEPEPLTAEERQRLAEEEERRREEREERRKQREEERKAKEEDREAKEEEDRFKAREKELEDAADEIDWGFASDGDGDEEWLNDEGEGEEGSDEKIDLDIDALTRSAPDVRVPDADRVPPKVKHSPIRSGRLGQSVTLRLTVSPEDDYTGVMYYRGAPNGSWNSMDISGNSRITTRLKLGSWISDDHNKVEYYFLVDGPGGSGGAGTRLSPYSFEIR